MFEMSGKGNTKPLARFDASPAERTCGLQTARPWGQGCTSPLELKSSHYMPWMLHMELQDFMFALQDFSLALIQAFLAIALFLPFEMGMFTLWNFMLELCNLFLILLGLTAKSLP
jgi:hypothetical protein